MSKNKLLSVFDNTINSYKYYWWLSVLKLIHKSGQSMNNVSYRFVRPWFPDSSKLRDSAVHEHILKYQDQINPKAPYRINTKERKIELNNGWFNWISENLMYVESFTLYKLFEYVEKNNPNIPNVSLKLFKPRARKLTTATRLWKSFIEDNPTQHLSIFDRKPLFTIKHLLIDHSPQTLESLVLIRIRLFY